MCLMHYERVRVNGTITPSHILRAESRFWSKVDKNGACWEWTCMKNPAGYGIFSAGRGNRWLAHRYAWLQLKGEIGERMSIDHRCHNPACVNPEHLREVTNKQNSEHLRGAYSTSKSGIRGVSWDKARGLWKATLTHNYKQVLVGRFERIEDAEAAITAKRLELFTHNDLDRVA